MINTFATKVRAMLKAEAETEIEIEGLVLFNIDSSGSIIYVY